MGLIHLGAGLDFFSPLNLLHDISLSQMVGSTIEPCLKSVELFAIFALYWVNPSILIQAPEGQG